MGKFQHTTARSSSDFDAQKSLEKGMPPFPFQIINLNGVLILVIFPLCLSMAKSRMM